MDRRDYIFGALGAVLGSFVAAIHPIVWMLLAAQTLDFASGVIAAAVTGQLDSDRGWRGIGRKALTWSVIASVYLAQVALGEPAPMAAVVCGFYIGIEGVSVLENAARAGVPVPPILTQMLARLQDLSRLELKTKGGADGPA